MARKTLLNESEIRRFMKLANIQSIGEERLSEMYHSAKRDDDEDEERMDEYSVDTYKSAAKRDYESDLSEEDEAEMDMGMDDDPMDMDKPAEDPMDEPKMDMDMDDDAPVGGAQINLDDFLSALESALEDVTGEEVSTDMDMDADEEEMDMGEEGGEDLAAPDMDDDLEMGMDDEEPGMRDPMMENEDEDLMEARVNRIAARVAQRLMAENKKASNIDALTERIFQRLAGK
jgi:hypothetical protein